MQVNPIIASLSKEYFKQFLTDVPEYYEIKQRIQQVNPDLSYEYLVNQIHSLKTEILITGWGSTPLPKTFLRDCPTIRYVCHLTGELKRIIPRSLIEEGLIVTNWGPVISDNIAEAAIFLILACCRRATDAVFTMHVQRGWRLKINPPVSLLEKRVGIHGFGNIAQQLSLLLKPFRCVVSAYSPPVPDTIFNSYSVKHETNLEHLFETNDIIVELEALTKNTEGMINKDYLNRIKPGGIFINVGRGRLVNERDLEEAAQRGLIYIGLDVYDQEPLPPDSPLRGLNNVFLTPHNAGPTKDRISLCGKYALSNIQAYQLKQPLKSIIGLAEYDRMT